MTIHPVVRRLAEPLEQEARERRAATLALSITDRGDVYIISSGVRASYTAEEWAVVCKKYNQKRKAHNRNAGQGGAA